MSAPPSYRQSIHEPPRPPRYGPNNGLSRTGSVSSRPSTSNAPEHIVSTKHIVLNLGPNVWRTRAPSYGQGESVSGYVDLRRLDNAKRVDIQVSICFGARVEQATYSRFPNYSARWYRYYLGH
jgi:hypothetical protein